MTICHYRSTGRDCGRSCSFCIDLPIFYAALCSTVILAPLIEEFAKAYPLFYRHGETERSLFKLGLGVAEFLSYVLVLGAPIPVGLPGMVFHAASTSITVYGITRNKPIRFYMIAVALHFLNNFSALFGILWFIGGITAISVAYILCFILYRRTTERFLG